MLTTVCTEGLSGLTNGAKYSRVTLIQDGKVVEMVEGMRVGDQKVPTNFHILCPRVNSLKSGEKLSYSVCKNDDSYELVDPSSTNPGKLSTISASVYIMNNYVDRMKASEQKPDESTLYSSLCKVTKGKFQLKCALLCTLAHSTYNLPPGAMLVYDIGLYVGLDIDFELPDSVFQNKFKSIINKYSVFLSGPKTTNQGNGYGKSELSLIDQLPAHAHYMRMFYESDGKQWYVVSINFDLCDFETIDLKTETHGDLKRTLQSKKNTSASCLILHNLYADVRKVAVPPCCFKTLPGDNQFCCSINTFFTCIKSMGANYSNPSSIVFLDVVLKKGAPRINVGGIFQNVNVSQIEKNIKDVFMIVTPPKKFSCGPIAEQVKAVSKNNELSLPARCLDVTWAVIINETIRDIPYSFSAVKGTIVFEGLCNDDLQAALITVNHAYTAQGICAGSCIDSTEFNFEKPDLADTSSTGVIIQYVLNEVLAKDIFPCNEFFVFLLRMVLDLKGDGDFGGFINVFDNMFSDKMDKFKISAECTDLHLQRMSHLYYISSMFGGMFATCDLLLTNRAITFFPSDEFRKHNFTNFDDDIYCFLWNVYANTPGTTSFCSKNLNAAAPHYTFSLLDWVCFFATCQLTLDRQDLDLKNHTPDAVKNYATKFVKDIADFNAENYVNHGEDRKIPSQPFSASLQNFCMTLGEHIQNLPPGKFAPNIYEVKPHAAVADAA